MSWVNALKEYAKQTGKFAVPKKGSPEYEAVKKIQQGMSAAPPTPAKVAEVKAVIKEKKIKAVKAAEKTPEQIAAETKQVKAAAKEKAAAKAAAEAAEKAAAAAARAAELSKVPPPPKAKKHLKTEEPPKEMPAKKRVKKVKAAVGAEMKEPTTVEFA
jgi:colicin import membrane protein